MAARKKRDGGSLLRGWKNSEDGDIKRKKQRYQINSLFRISKRKSEKKGKD